MSTKNYESKVSEILATEQSKREQIMREKLTREAETGNVPLTESDISTMDSSELRDAFDEHVDPSPMTAEIELILERFGGDEDAVAAAMAEIADMSPSELLDYGRDAVLKSVIASVNGSEKMSPLPLEDALRHNEAAWHSTFREGVFEQVPGLIDLPDAKVREILEKAADQARQGGEEFDYDAAIAKAKEETIQKAVDDAGITKAAEDVRKALEELANAADQAGRDAVAEAGKKVAEAVEGAAKVAEDTTNAVEEATDGAAKAAQEGVAAAAKAAEDAVNELENSVREGVEEGGKLAKTMRDDLDKRISDVTDGVDGATGRLKGAADDLLNGLGEGIAELVAGTSMVGGYQFTFGFDLKLDMTPPARGSTEERPGDSNPMTPGKTPDGTPDERSGGNRLRDMQGERIIEKSAEGRPGTGSSGNGSTSTTGTPPGGGSGGGGSGGGGSAGGGGFDTQLPPLPGTGTATGGGGGTTGSSGTGTDTSGDGEFSWSFGAATKINGQWYDSDGNAIDDATAQQLLDAQDAATGDGTTGDGADGAAGDAAGADAATVAESEASNETDLEYSTDGFDAEPTGIETPVTHMVDDMVQQYRDITAAARAGAQVNPVREGVEVGHMTLDDLPTARDLQQPPPGEGFVENELVDRRGPDYSSSTGAGVINDPDMTFDHDGPMNDPADLDLDRPEDLGHLAEGITGNTTAGAVRTPGPPPSGVDPADLRIGDPIDVGRATFPVPTEQPSFGSGARGEAYTTAPRDPSFGTGDAGDTSTDSITPDDPSAVDFVQSEPAEPEPEPQPHPEPEPEPEPVSFEPAPMHAIGDPVAGGGSTSDTSGSTFEWSIGRTDGLENLDRGIEGLDLGRIERTSSDTTNDDDLGDAG